jgi:hypothetical protein
MNIDGHCLCGKVGFSLRSEANWSCYCHCEDCRRNCAAPIVAFFAFHLRASLGTSKAAHKNQNFFRPHQVLNGFSATTAAPQWHSKLSTIRERLLFMPQL